jgi:large repetitive protein
MKRLHVFPGILCALLLFSAAHTRAAAPAAPDYVKVAWIENLEHFLVRWAPVSDATNYNVYRYDTNSATWTHIASNLTVLNVPMFRDPTVPNPGPVIYAVTAVNADGEGPATTASLTPAAGHYPYYTYDWDPPVGYTFGMPSFQGSYLGGTDGMIELGFELDVWTNVLDVSWRTNIDYGYRVMFTNLTAGTVYYWRLTAVEENGNGITLVSPNFRFVTLPAPVFTVNEEEPTQLQIGHWGIQDLQYLTSPSHGMLEPHWWGDHYKIYTSDTNFVGTDTFQILDNTNGPPVTVTINVQNVNDSPVAQPFTVYVPEDSLTVITPPVYDPENNAYQVWLTDWDWSSGNMMWLNGTNFLFEPLTNFVGTIQFMYMACDDQNTWQSCGLSAQGTIIVINVNDAPVANNMEVTAHAGSPYTWRLNATDADGDSWEAELVTPATTGTVTISGTYFTYTPGPGQFYNDSFTYRASDGQSTGSTGTVTIYVAGPNTPPEVADQSVAVLEKNAESTWTLTATDADLDPLQAYLVTAPTNGTVSFDGITAIYRRDVTNMGPDTFAYHVSDGSSTSSVAIVSIEVITNRPPIADPMSVTTAEDTPINIYVTATDPDGDDVSWEIVTPAAYGFLWNGPWFYYAPGGNYNGPDSFTFRAFDGRLYSDPVTVNITVTPVNDAPVRVTPPRVFMFAEDGFQDFDLVATDVDGDTLTYQIVNPPTNGVITFRSANGAWTYRPNTNWFGSDSVSWRATDGQLYSSVGTISFVVTPVNDAPIALPQTVTTSEDTARAITLQGTDPEGSPLTYTITSWPAGTVEGTGQNIIYRPPTNFFGTQSLTFRVRDGILESAPATVTIIVTSVNDPPVAHNKSVSTTEDTPVAIALTGSDVENAPLTFLVVDPPAHGTFTGNIYTPAANYHGPDSFTYKAREGSGLESAPATVSITVTAVNDAPVADSKSATVNEDASVAIALTGSDVEGDALTFAIVSAPQHGQFIDGVYTPAANYNGPDSFTYKANDGSLDSAVATVSITVTPVNDAPVADSKSVSTAEDQSLAIALSGSDVEGSALMFIVVDPPAHGTFVGGTYTPAANYNGPDSFTYKANDGSLDSAVATVSITVTPVNDAPVADNQSISTAEDQSIAVALTGSDVDGDSLAFTVVNAPTHGTFANGVYTPAADYNGTDSFTYKANDSQLDSALATVTVTVTAVNDAPVANAQSVSTPYNTAVNITLTGTDVEGSALSFTVVSGPANGTLTGSDANRTFTPNIGWYGTTSFTFGANDGALDSATATVTITVAAPTGVPGAPTSLTATPVSQNQINLAWNDNSGNEDGFKIERASSAGGPWTQIATVGPNVRNYSNTGLTKNTRYYYRVRAYNVLGNSAYSNTVNARTLN